MCGFWQVVADPSEEEVFEFRGTTTTERAGHGLLLYTRRHFVEIRIAAIRRPPIEHPPTGVELRSMFDVFVAAVGTYTSQSESAGSAWRIDHQPIASTGSPPNSRVVRRSDSGSDDVVVVDADRPERWRRLSGPGHSPLSGVWVSGNESDRWLYLTTAGHYGITHTDLTAPADPSTLSINMGARIETAASFDHWPMASQVFGYDVRKHESFRIEAVHHDRFTASIPTFDFPATEWTRLE